MRKTIYVNCSFCEGLMEIDVETGEVVQKWSPKDKNKGGDTMADALRKLGEDKKKEVDRVKKEGVKDAPPRPFDLD